jgi:hypothetical protein
VGSRTKSEWRHHCGGSLGRALAAMAPPPTSSPGVDLLIELLLGISTLHAEYATSHGMLGPENRLHTLEEGVYSV